MKHGFTLIELLVVVLIIGILAAVALPKYRVAVERARVAQALPLLRALVQAKERYYMANGEHTADLDNLDVQISYGSKTEGGNGESWRYSGGTIPGVCLNISPTSEGVFWQGKSVVIDTYSSSQLCYPIPSQQELGTKVCSSLGPSTGRINAIGTPVYKVEF